tara:strand:+ start:464 stop:2086 length:1623 start_codon:yes stop_codon:yes gene_type:complete
MSNLLKALPRQTANDYRRILVNLYTDKQMDKFISETVGANVAGRRKAIQYFLDNPESFAEIRAIDGVDDRAKKILEAIKNIKTGQQVGGSKGSQFPNILEKFKSGDIQSLPNWSNSANTPETKKDRVKNVRDNKTKLFDAIENFGEVKQTQAYEMLKNTYNIDKPAPDTYTISARPNSQKMIAYLRKVVTSSNIPKRNKKEMFDEPKGTDEFLGNDYNELYPALIYIIETKDLPVDSSGNLESRGFQKKKTKLSIATKQALKGLRGSESPSGLKSIMDKIIRNTKEDIKNKKVYQDNKFLKEIAKDVDLKKQFEEYIRRLSAGVSLNKLPADDYLALASERENPTYEEYGFEGAEDFEDWVTEYDERTVAFDNMQNRSGYYVLSTVNDLKHLSRLFTEEDIDIKQTLFEIQERDSEELGQPDKRFRVFKDLIPMLEGVGLVLGVVDGNDGFGNYYGKFRDAEDKETREENYELMLKELINEGLYRKIREALRNWIYNSMKKVVEDNYRINIKGVTEPIKVLEKLKIATKKVESSEAVSDE